MSMCSRASSESNRKIKLELNSGRQFISYLPTAQPSFMPGIAPDHKKLLRKPDHDDDYQLGF